jgi:hypothetical protein
MGKGSKGRRNSDKWNYILQDGPYADDIDIKVISPTALEEALLSLERAAGVMGLKISEEQN